MPASLRRNWPGADSRQFPENLSIWVSTSWTLHKSKRFLDDPESSIARPWFRYEAGNHAVIENRKETTMSNTIENSQAKEPVNPPVAKIRVGLTTASIWERAAGKSKYHTVSFERRYRNKEGNWLTSKTFDTAD